MSGWTHYLYCYTNRVNGHTYVGQTVNPKRRHKEHKCSPNKKSTSKCAAFTNAIRKYGFEAFDYEVLYQTNSKADIDEQERWLIAELGCEYNISAGGDGATKEFCKRRHGPDRELTVRGDCVECVRIRNKERWAKCDKALARARQNQWATDNREYVNSKANDYYHKNSEHILARLRESYRAKKEVAKCL